MMLDEQTLSAIRTLLKIFGALPIGVIVFHWLGIDADTVMAAIGAIAIIAGTVASALANRKKSLVSSAADIIHIDAAQQARVGIDTPITPTNPPKPPAT